MSTHIDANGNAIMVDVSGKAATFRTARAEGRILLARPVMESIKAGRVAKGDVLGVAQLAGIMGAKRTPDLIPLCHPLPLSSCRVLLELEEDIECGAADDSAHTAAADQAGRSERDISSGRDERDMQAGRDWCAIRVICEVKTTNQTGVEMEALTGVSVALLTVYDMCKGQDKSLEITGIKLLEKTGGKSGDFIRK